MVEADRRSERVHWKPANRVHLLMKCLSDAEHTVLPALLLLAEPNEPRQESAAIPPDH